MAAAASRVLRGRSDGCGFRVPGGRCVAFIGVDVPLTCGPRRGRGGMGRVGLDGILPGHDAGKTEDFDGQGQHVGERRGKEGAEWAWPRGEKK